MQGKHDKVISVLKKIAIVNKKTLPNLSLDTQIEVIHFIKYQDIRF